MLACARIGAVHMVVFGGFGSKELAARIDDGQAKYVISASCGIEPGRLVDYKTLLDDALKMASHPVSGCAIFQRPQMPCQLTPKRDCEWEEFIAAVSRRLAFPYRQPTRFISYTPPARPANPRALCVITADTP